LADDGNPAESEVKEVEALASSENAAGDGKANGSASAGAVAKPGPFDLNKFKSKRADAIANVDTLQTGSPISSMSQAKDFVRLHPDEDQSKFLDQIRAVINDPSVEVRWARDRYRPAGSSRLNTELFTAIEAETKKMYGVDVLPTMSTGASDKAQIRSKGVQCYGVGPAIDYEDGGKGYGAHSDQERSSRPSCTSSCAGSTTWPARGWRAACR